MPGERLTFVGAEMATIVQGIAEVRSVIGQPPVVVGGLAVLCRLSSPYRATTDLDVVDRRRGATPHPQVLRAVSGAEPVEPAAVLLPTAFGPVKVDVLEVRQIEIDHPSADPGGRLHASAHAWAHDTATNLTIEAVTPNRESIEVTTPVAESGPLIAMKLQAVMNRSTQKQGTDLLDILRLAFDAGTRDAALEQIRAVDDVVARDIAIHVELWFGARRTQALEWVHREGGADLATDDIDLVAELLGGASRRT